MANSKPYATISIVAGLVCRNGSKIKVPVWHIDLELLGNFFWEISRCPSTAGAKSRGVSLVLIKQHLHSLADDDLAEQYAKELGGMLAARGFDVSFTHEQETKSRRWLLHKSVEWVSDNAPPVSLRGSYRPTVNTLMA